MMIVIREAKGLVGDADKIRALNNILMACGEAKHVLWMPAKEIEKIVDSKTISGYQLNVLSYIKEQSRLTKTLISDVEFYVEVDFDGKAPPHYTMPNKLLVSYEYFIDSAYVQPPIFVCENLSDIDFYMLGARNHLYDLKMLSEYDLKFEMVGGGGNTTINSFQYHFDNKKLIICVLDSDKAHPNANVKDTAARFAAHAEGWGRGYWLHILNCTEAENLVPWSIAEYVLDVVGLKTAAQQFTALSPAARQYLDHKKGLMYSEALGLDKSYHHKHWSGLIGDAQETDHWICQPLGPSFLDRCITTMQGMSVMKLNEKIDHNKDKEFLTLSSMVASWGISYKKAIR
ncbi:hypothetical protein [Pseudomonas syringae]|uniref:hypothetical protein n=1 Tax=Pseudomonas syringae TaxID=317 RepID=UPI0003521DCB|nr:hypothetical protein [Pseudomonas syringae]EPF65939.1 Hypothetical protein PssSM_1858 [Pseudomonas syringae pv. syringae SM]